MPITQTCNADRRVEFSDTSPAQAAARHALAHAATLDDICGPAVADAITALGRHARRAGLSYDDLLAVVDDVVQGAHADDRPEPPADAMLLHLWRVAWRAFEATPAHAAAAWHDVPLRRAG